MEREIITRFLNRTASPEETRQVLAWLEKPEARKVFDEHIKNTWETSSIKEKDQTDYNKLLQKIHSRTSVAKGPNPSKSISWYKTFKVAASIVLLIGSIIFLKKGLEFKEPNLALPEKVIERKTGIGEKLTMNLPDGTSIVLNANSSIIFSSGYGDKNRLVELDGEGYFQIAKDSLRPFQVKTEGMVTTALGTAFNTIAREGFYAIALTEGKVAIETGEEELKLNPGQMLVLDKRDSLSGLEVRTFETDKVIGWKEGILHFDRVQLKKILEELAKWYGVELEIETGINVNKRVIGTFRNKNLGDVLTGLGFSMGFQFEIDKNRVLIKKSSL
ncbi:FecR domain-containing protein [Cyclobacterium sp. 1_MG-2023]|uniref:FecR family protein n=1 Tax=Cyclobacterium sp. 1_MG-2023 TaxID=3062681 RepID=UPI0026E2F50B|nr:FecR domain-containing protein [Cyclobacterium sp. 1_MG-2023]MDO6439305.1 FecR domain-containing protein [Cyclobacterium sp. 1_MG-2023]